MAKKAAEGPASQRAARSLSSTLHCFVAAYAAHARAAFLSLGTARRKGGRDVFISTLILKRPLGRPALQLRLSSSGLVVRLPKQRPSCHSVSRLGWVVRLNQRQQGGGMSLVEAKNPPIGIAPKVSP